MKKVRNCGEPMYPNFSVNGTMPIMSVPTPIMMPPQNYSTPQNYTPNYNTTYNNIEQQINNMQQQITNLENRVSKLESKANTTTYNNKYNDSNYYML